MREWKGRIDKNKREGKEFNETERELEKWVNKSKKKKLFQWSTMVFYKKVLCPNMKSWYKMMTWRLVSFCCQCKGIRRERGRWVSVCGGGGQEGGDRISFFLLFVSVHYFFFIQDWNWIGGVLRGCLSFKWVSIFECDVCYSCLCSLSSDSSGQLNVLRHNCYPLSVNGTQVGIFKKTDQVSFTGFL